MMNKKKLSTIRKEVQDAAGRTGQDVGEWLRREIRKLERKPEPDPREIETLLLLRNALAGAKPKRAKV